MIGATLAYILMCHLYSYRFHYLAVGLTFSVTFVIKKLVKSAGFNHHAGFIGIRSE